MSAPLSTQPPTAPHCNTQQHTATHCTTAHCNALQRAAIYTPRSRAHHPQCHHPLHRTATQQHTATHCNTLQHMHLNHERTASIAPPNPPHCNTQQHTATHCNTLQDTILYHKRAAINVTTHRTAVQHTTAHCNTLQHAAIHAPESRARRPQHAVCNPLNPASQASSPFGAC